MDSLKRVSFLDVDITGGYLRGKQDLNSATTIYAVQHRFEETGRFEAFKFNWKEGADVPQPHYYWDSDVAKWLEAAAYIVAKNGDPLLASTVTKTVDLIEEHQDPCGYYNIYHTVVEPDNRFRDRDHHELYCLGHFIEAAVAVYTCMGQDKLIKIVDRYIDYVIKVFCEEKSAGFVTPGHEEIELALIRLYEIIPDKKYLDLAMFFLDKRGTAEEGLTPWSREKYNQSHLPVRQQKEAFGHSVRACYLYTGMAAAAGVTGDEEMQAACKALFDDVTERKMYISGGIGSTNKGEAFTIPYDLPSNEAYTESCAGIALAFFAGKLQDTDINSKYADVIERLVYNGIMSSLSLDGKGFFYENPMEINLADYDRFTCTNDRASLPLPQRSAVFGCSCCPPNITRFIASLGDYMLSCSEDTIYLHQFAQLKAKTPLAGIEVSTEYPLDGRVTITVRGGKGRKLAVRNPGWCKNTVASEKYASNGNGYMYFDIVSDEQTFTVDFEIKPAWYASSPEVRHCTGKAALMLGPVLYCAEKCDNGFDLWKVFPDTKAQPEISYDNYFGENTIKVKGTLVCGGAKLYDDLSSLTYRDVDIKFIPYAGFANRGESDMRVWFNYR